MTDAEYFDSKSNYVLCRRDENGEYIEKTYRRKLRNYDVEWPESRAFVEAFFLGYLKSKQTRHVSVPQIYQYIPPGCIQMEYCKGTPLSDAPVNDLMDIDMWTVLFGFLQSLSELPYAFVKEQTNGAFQKQEEIFRCMIRWKMQGRLDVPYPEQNCVCLGDVSVNNILVSGKRFYLLDFECAHWGYTGYDIGQLLGMLNATMKNRDVLEVVKKAFQKTVLVPSVYENCLYWKKRFCDYYQK